MGDSAGDSVGVGAAGWTGTSTLVSVAAWIGSCRVAVSDGSGCGGVAAVFGSGSRAGAGSGSGARAVCRGFERAAVSAFGCDARALPPAAAPAELRGRRSSTIRAGFESTSSSTSTSDAFRRMRASAPRPLETASMRSASRTGPGVFMRRPSVVAPRWTRISPESVRSTR